MQKLTRREFVLMCGSAAAGIIGSTLVFSKLPKEIETKYISNIMVNPNEFLILNKDSKGVIYILINGISKNDVGETRFLVVIPFLIYSILLLSSAFKCGRYYANNNERKILDNYYIAYYAASENKKHEDISIIESQVAFILNMIFPLLLFILIPSNRLSFLDTGICDYSTMVPAIKALVFVGIILISVCAYMRQMTIYRRVWEDYEFLNKP